MITIHLTKLETALEQVKKAQPKLNPADQALMTTALVLAGRHAVAVYNDKPFAWPDDYKELTAKLAGDIIQVQNQLDEGKKVVKKTAKVIEAEEAIPMVVDLKPNFEAGQALLEEREDLQTLLSDTLQEGVEFVYAGNDIGWQWALDRANWPTISDDMISRKVKIKVRFAEGAVGSEVGAAAKTKRRR